MEYFSFGIVLNQIWWSRNQLVFNNTTLYVEGIVNKVFRLAQDSVVALEVSMLDSKSVTRRVGDIGIRWEPPCRGEVTINCDGFLCGCG